MNNFTKSWITSTLAPESIVSVRSGALGFLDCITDEKRTKRIFVLSNNTSVIAIGETYDEIINSKILYSFNQAVLKCAELLNIGGISVVKQK